MQCDQLNEVYSVWSKKQVKKENSPECISKFAALFQNIQIRSSSEAMAETVGSIMANRIGKGRYLGVCRCIGFALESSFRDIGE